MSHFHFMLLLDYTIVVPIFASPFLYCRSSITPVMRLDDKITKNREMMLTEMDVSSKDNNDSYYDSICVQIIV